MEALEWLRLMVNAAVKNDQPLPLSPTQCAAIGIDLETLKHEMDVLREFAGGQCVTHKVIDELGPMSLWSRQGLEDYVQARIKTADPQSVGIFKKSL